MLLFIAGGAVLLICLIGAIGAALTGGEEPSGTAQPTDAAVDQPPQAEEYGDVQDVREAVEAAGHTCSSYRVTDDPIGALQRAECTSGTTLGIYRDQAEAWASIDALRGLNDIIGDTSVHLVGPNWTVNCGDRQTLCEDLQAELGGEIDVYEPA